jgi:D-alanyl-D-alanine carboxypeptidase (penicillin-binding protein 5/6)
MHLLKFLLFVILFAFYNQKLNADFDVESNYMILQDYHSEQILFEKDADTAIYPASMTKIMK